MTSAPQTTKPRPLSSLESLQSVAGVSHLPSLESLGSLASGAGVAVTTRRTRLGRKGGRKWAQLEAMVEMDKRIALMAEDLVKHWEARYAAMEGKAMVVCVSRRICGELYKAIQKLRPDWHHDEDDTFFATVVVGRLNLIAILEGNGYRVESQALVG